MQNTKDEEGRPLDPFTLEPIDPDAAVRVNRLLYDVESITEYLLTDKFEDLPLTDAYNRRLTEQDYIRLLDKAEQLLSPDLYDQIGHRILEKLPIRYTLVTFSTDEAIHWSRYFYQSLSKAERALPRYQHDQRQIFEHGEVMIIQVPYTGDYILDTLLPYTRVLRLKW